MIAAAYLRKSTDQSGVADEEKSIARQLEHARAYAIKKGWTLAEEFVYTDDGISGAEFAKRPSYLRLLNALKPRPPFRGRFYTYEGHVDRMQPIRGTVRARAMVTPAGFEGASRVALRGIIRVA